LVGKELRVAEELLEQPASVALQGRPQAFLEPLGAGRIEAVFARQPLLR
jgi:hypothetical protein